MHTLVNVPQVSESYTVIGSLEHEVVLEWSLIDEFVDKELNFIKHTNMIVFVLNLEVTVCRCAVTHVNHVLCVNQLGQLFVRGCTGPGAIVKRTLDDDLVVGRRVCC